MAVFAFYSFEIKPLRFRQERAGSKACHLSGGLFVGILLGIDRAAYVHRSDGCSRNAFGRDRWGIQQDTQTAFC